GTRRGWMRLNRLDSVGQSLKRFIWLDPKLLGQNRLAGAVYLEGGGAASGIKVQFHETEVGSFIQRRERDPAACRLDGRCDILARGVSLIQSLQDGVHPDVMDFTSHAYPVVKFGSVTQRESFKKVASVEPGGLLKLRQGVRRLAVCGKALGD